MGGPETFTLREIAELAFAVLGRPARIRSVPAAVLRGASALVRPINGNVAALLRVTALFGRLDPVGAPHGTHTLRAYFEQLRDQGPPQR